MGSNGQLDGGTCFFCQVNESTRGCPRVAKGGDRLHALRRLPGAAVASCNARQVGDHRGEGVRLVHHHGNQQAHGDSFQIKRATMIRASLYQASHRRVSPATLDRTRPMRQCART